MRVHPSTVVSAAMLCLIGASATLAGPDWEEIGDAGSTRASAQPITGVGPIGGIKGRTGAPTPLAGLIDEEDMYVFQIVEPSKFCALTVAVRKGVNFDTQLFLFDSDGIGVLGNDDSPDDPTFSRILPLSDDGSGAVLLNPGIYYLAVSGGNGPAGGRDPASIGGPIFSQTSLTEISGPDGPGSASEVTSWIGSGGVGDYQIILCASVMIEGVPTLGEAAMLLLAVSFAVFGWRMLRK